jgi:hypothetical protein
MGPVRAISAPGGGEDSTRAGGSGGAGAVGRLLSTVSSLSSRAGAGVSVGDPWKTPGNEHASKATNMMLITTNSLNRELPDILKNLLVKSCFRNLFIDVNDLSLGFLNMAWLQERRSDTDY